MDIRLQPVGAFAILGALDGPFDTAHTVFLRLVASSDVDGGPRIMVAEQRVLVGSAFEFSRVPNGAYSLEAQGMNALSWAKEDVLVDGHDIRVVIHVTPTLSLTGVTVWEGLTRPPDFALIRPPTAFHSDYPCRRRSKPG